MKKQTKTKLFIAGIGGRMGQELVRAAEESLDWLLIGGFDRKPVEGQTIFRDLSKVKASSFDILIDFSSPEVFDSVVDYCVKNKKPMVSGTTGLSVESYERLKKSGKKIPILWAPNMSIGVAMFTTLIEQVARLRDFDFQVEEFHHRHKKDKPSGTALLLQRALELSTKSKQPEPVAIRGGGIFGIHRLHCMSPDETITIEHTALNRSVFAMGALTAAKWVLSQKPGLYELKDTL
jgi:4-hydroxy-tetrahydrodipicolinate reductase